MSLILKNENKLSYDEKQRYPKLNEIKEKKTE